MPLSDKIAKIYLGRKSSKASARNSAKSTSKPTQRKNRAPERPSEAEEIIETQNIGLEGQIVKIHHKYPKKYHKSVPY